MLDSNIFFFTATSFMIAHEMDAVRQKEWRIFPILNLIDEKYIYQVFILAHVLVYILTFCFLVSEYSNQVILALDLFFIAHFIIHIFFLRNEKNEFKNWISWITISGAALFGTIDLFLKF